MHATRPPVLLRPLRPSDAPLALHQQPQPQRTRLLVALGRVPTVRIPTTLKENGHRFYVVEVKPTASHDTSTGVPSRVLGTTLSLTSSPTIKWRFADFVNLRDELYYHLRAAHRYQKVHCDFCTHALLALAHAPSLPALHQLVFTSASPAFCQQLERFVNAVLQLALSIKSCRELAWCGGQGMTLLLVKRFVLGKGDETENENDATVAPHAARGCRVDPFRPVASAGLAFS